MKIRLNGFEIKLKGSRLKIYKLLKEGYIIKFEGIFKIYDQKGIFINNVHNSTLWTIRLMKYDGLIVMIFPAYYGLNPLIEEIK